MISSACQHTHGRRGAPTEPYGQASALQACAACQSAERARRSTTNIASQDSAANPVEDGSTIPAGTSVGEYQIVRRIGVGGMGEVYEAVHPLIGKRAAVKVIGHHLCQDAEAVHRFMVEARAANEIGSRFIVDVFSFGRLDDGRSYQIMELLVGDDLGDRLQAGAMPAAEALSVFEQIAGAVEAAHACDVIHRDLKPDNVFLVESETGTQVKLLDFGIAKLVGDRPNAANITAAGMVLGTPAYMSPEQIRGEKVAPATDIYALGVLLFEMLAGHPPFRGHSAADVMAAHLRRPPPRLEISPPAPKALSALVARMLNKSAPLRPTAVEVRDAIRAMQWRKPEALPSPPRSHPPQSRRPMVLLLASLPLVAAALFLLWPRGEQTSRSAEEVKRGAATPTKAPKISPPTPGPAPEPAKVPTPAPAEAVDAPDRAAKTTIPSPDQSRRRSRSRSKRANRARAHIQLERPGPTPPEPVQRVEAPGAVEPTNPVETVSPRPVVDRDAPIADPFAP